MTFGDALAHMKQGGKARRSVWSAGDFVRLEDGEFALYIGDRRFVFDLAAISVLAEDWESAMTFGDALAHVRQGKVAWRRAWAPEHELRAKAKCLMLSFDRETRQERVFVPRQDDLFAEDWDAGVEVTRR